MFSDENCFHNEKRLIAIMTSMLKCPFDDESQFDSEGRSDDESIDDDMIPFCLYVSCQRRRLRHTTAAL